MTIKEIDETIEEGESLKAVAQAYSEIANIKIKKIRRAVERNRLFFEEISKVYSFVKNLAIKKKVAMLKPKNRLCILLTSNYRFYGNINSSLIKYFVGSTRELKDVDTLILGTGGVDYFRATKLLPNYQQLILNTDLPNQTELRQLADLSSNYNQVSVFHSKFKSLLIQQATFTDVTAVSFYLKQRVQSLDVGETEDMKHFIFEPELIKILKFFDTQILTLLLEGTFLESELSRTASRFIAMDQAEIEANKFIKEYLNLKAYAKTSQINNAILENFASIVAIKKGLYGH